MTSDNLSGCLAAGGEADGEDLLRRCNTAPSSRMAGIAASAERIY